MSRRNLLRRDSGFFGSDSKADYEGSDDFDAVGNRSVNGMGGSGGSQSFGGSLGEPLAPPMSGGSGAAENSTQQASGKSSTNGGSSTKRIEPLWTPEKEQLLKDWAQQSLGYAWMHERAAKNYNSWHTLLSVPAVVLSGGVGVSVLGVDNATSTSKLVQATVSLFTGGLISLQAFLKYEKTAEQHMQMYRQFVSFHSDIITELALPRVERHMSVQYINDLKKKWKEMIRIAPTIPSSIIDDFSNKMKQFSNISKPFLTFPGEEVFEIKIDSGLRIDVAVSNALNGGESGQENESEDPPNPLSTTAPKDVAQSILSAAASVGAFGSSPLQPTTGMTKNQSNSTIGEPLDIEQGQPRRVARKVLAPLIVVPSAPPNAVVESPSADQMNQIIRQSIEASKRAVMAEKRRRSAQAMTGANQARITVSGAEKRLRKSSTEYSPNEAMLYGAGSAEFKARRDALLRKRQLMQGKIDTLHLTNLEQLTTTQNTNSALPRNDYEGGVSGSSNDSNEYKVNEIVRNVLEKPGRIEDQSVRTNGKQLKNTSRSREAALEETQLSESTQSFDEIAVETMLGANAREEIRVSPRGVLSRPRVLTRPPEELAAPVGETSASSTASPRSAASHSTILAQIGDVGNDSENFASRSILSVPAPQRRQTRETRDSRTAALTANNTLNTLSPSEPLPSQQSSVSAEVDVGSNDVGGTPEKRNTHSDP